MSTDPPAVVPGDDVPNWSAYASEVCSVARTAAVLADPWTVLLVRDLHRGLHRFDALVEHLGVARTVLTRRLEHLVGAGIVERAEYREPGRRTRAEYHLTERGRALGPVLLALMQYGDRHLDGGDGPPMVRRHADCGAPVRQVSRCTAGHVLGPEDRVDLMAGPGARLRPETPPPDTPPHPHAPHPSRSRSAP